MHPNRHQLIAALAATLALAGCKMMKQQRSVELKTEQDKVLYALGHQVGTTLKPFTLTQAELDIVKGAIDDVNAGRPAKVDSMEYQMKVRDFYMARSKAAADKVKEEGKKVLENAAKEPGAERTESGLVFIPITPGSGESPAPQDRVKVNYEGKLPNGTVFDSTLKRGQPQEFALFGVIPCWTQGIQKMKAGGKAKLVCPSDLAYGDRGSPPTIPGGSPLIFEVELLSINKNAAPMQMPGVGSMHPGMTMPPGGMGGGHPGMTPPSAAPGGRPQAPPAANPAK